MQKPELSQISVFDVETTTHNKGHPFDPRNVAVSYTINERFSYYSDPDFISNLGALNSGSLIVGFNIKFDINWLNNLGHSIDGTPVWDCQLAEFVYSGQKDVLISLDECLERYGLPTKTNEVAAMWDAGVQTTEIPVATLQEYNVWDTHVTKLLYQVQQQLLSEKQKALVLLLGEDLKVLSHIEQAGIKFDVDGATKEIASIDAKVATIEEQLDGYLPTNARKFFNWDSGDDLSCFLYGGTRNYDYAVSSDAVYKSGEKKGQAYVANKWYVESISFPQHFEPLEDTEIKKTKDKQVDTHLYQTDEPTLKQLKSRRKEDRTILALLAERSAIVKVGEMLKSILKQFNDKQWQDGLMHGQYNQNIVVTGRLSSSAPNQQNMPEDVSKFLVTRYAD